jgi:hypothetical protein
MNPAATEYYLSMNSHFQQPRNDYTNFIFSYLSTNYQVQNVQPTLHERQTSSTLLTLITNCSTHHTQKSTHSSLFSFVLYDISSLSVPLILQYGH